MTISSPGSPGPWLWSPANGALPQDTATPQGTPIPQGTQLQPPTGPLPPELVRRSPSTLQEGRQPGQVADSRFAAVGLALDQGPGQLSLQEMLDAIASLGNIEELCEEFLGDEDLASRNSVSREPVGELQVPCLQGVSEDEDEGIDDECLDDDVSLPLARRPGPSRDAAKAAICTGPCRLAPLDASLRLTPEIMRDYIMDTFGSICPDRITFATEILRERIGREMRNNHVLCSLALCYEGLPDRHHEISENTLMWARRILVVLVDAGGQRMSPMQLKEHLRQRHGDAVDQVSLQAPLGVLAKRDQIEKIRETEITIGGLLSNGAVGRLRMRQGKILRCLEAVLRYRETHAPAPDGTRPPVADFRAWTNNRWSMSICSDAMAAVYGMAWTAERGSSGTAVEKRDRVTKTDEQRAILDLLRNQPDSQSGLWEKVKASGIQMTHRALASFVRSSADISRANGRYYLKDERVPRQPATASLDDYFESVWDKAIDGVLATYAIDDMQTWNLAIQTRKNQLKELKKSDPDVQAMLKSEEHARLYKNPPYGKRFYKRVKEVQAEHDITTKERRKGVVDYMQKRADGTVVKRITLQKNVHPKLDGALRRLVNDGILDKVKGGYSLATQDTPIPSVVTPAISPQGIETMAWQQPWTPQSMVLSERDFAIRSQQSVQQPPRAGRGQTHMSAPVGDQLRNDPASGLAWYGQDPNGCLQSAMRNLVGGAGALQIRLPAPGPDQHGAAGELQMACFDSHGQPRRLPDGRSMDQLVIPSDVLAVMAPLLDQLHDGLILYQGDTSKEGAASNGVSGHFVTLRRGVNDPLQWYLVDSMGTGPVPVDPGAYVQSLPHGLMAAVPVDAGLQGTQLWQTYQAMAAFPRIQSVCAMLRMRVAPHDLMDWLQQKNLAAVDLDQPEVVAALLSELFQRPWSVQSVANAGVLQGRPAQVLNHAQALQLVRTQPGADAGVRQVLDHLDASGQDTAVLCLGTEPLHVMAWRRNGQWMCDAKTAVAVHAQPVEQPLREVLESSLAQVVESLSLLPPSVDRDWREAERSRVHVITPA